MDTIRNLSLYYMDNIYIIDTGPAVRYLNGYRLDSRQVKPIMYTSYAWLLLVQLSLHLDLDDINSDLLI
jgi:hypothetical protein